MKTNLKNKIPTNINNMLVDGLTLEQWIEKKTKERTAIHQTVPTKFSPVICDIILGDGLQLIYFGTIDQRPYHWLIRIDSETDIESDDFDIEMLLQPLEECFGRHPDNYYDKEEFEEAKNNDRELESYDNFEEYDSACQYPAVLYSGGHWGLVVNMVTGEVGLIEQR